MNKTVVFLLTGDLGKIIFCQGIAQFYIKGGYKVYWPVQQKYIAALRQAYPHIEWLHDDWYSRDPSVRYDLLHSLCAPLDKSYTFNGSAGQYKSKYDMYNLNWEKWRDSAIFDTNKPKCNSLWFDELKLRAAVEYDLCTPGTEPLCQNPVKIEHVDGYNIFDWVLVFQLARSIHVPYSACFILDLIDIKAPEVHVYGNDHVPDINLFERHKYIIH